MHQCCASPYDQEFDKVHAQKDLNDYKSRGLKKNSIPLVRLLRGLDLEGLSLLDIGGGVGTVVFELFDEGINDAAHVDISSAYVQAFRSEAAIRSLSHRIKSYLGDFMDVQEQIEKVDVVSLDKVICCYANYTDLVQKSVKKATKWYAFVVPRDVWWVKWAHHLEGKWNKMRGKYFETYIHPVSQIENIIKEEGFQLHDQAYQREWYYAIYQRQNESMRV